MRFIDLLAYIIIVGSLVLIGVIVGIYAIDAHNESEFVGAWQDEETCETDSECVALCLRKLPPNRPESECDI